MGNLTVYATIWLRNPTMANKRQADNPYDQYIRERIRLARTEAGDSQDDLAKVFQKSRVAISDIERGRVTISAVDLGFIAAYYGKPISYFYPPRVKLEKTELSTLAEEILNYFEQLPEQQQYISLAYVKQQLELSLKAHERYAIDTSSKKKTE
jgi:transcriptional regulator with XRE-family HTH domain